MSDPVQELCEAMMDFAFRTAEDTLFPNADHYECITVSTPPQVHKMYGRRAAVWCRRSGLFAMSNVSGGGDFGRWDVTPPPYANFLVQCVDGLPPRLFRVDEPTYREVVLA